MKVQELITLLQKVDPEMDVAINDADTNWTLDILNVSIDIFPCGKKALTLEGHYSYIFCEDYYEKRTELK